MLEQLLVQLGSSLCLSSAESLRSPSPSMRLSFDSKELRLLFGFRFRWLLLLSSSTSGHGTPDFRDRQRRKSLQNQAGPSPDAATLGSGNWESESVDRGRSTRVRYSRRRALGAHW